MKPTRGFTLVEVLVALVIVAFGMSAVLAALSSSADNIASLRDKTIAEWIAMNQIADARLNLNLPKTGVTEGDVKDFGGSDWHWRQDVMAVQMVPGMLEIAVRVRRLQKGTSSSSRSSSGSSSTSGGNARGTAGSSGGSSSGPPSSFFSSSSSGLGGSAFGPSGGFGSSGGGFGSSGPGSSGLGLSSSSGMLNKTVGVMNLPTTGDDQHWVTTVIGFRGDAVAAASGETPDWSCNATGGGSLCGNTSSGGTTGTSSGTIAGPNSGQTVTSPSANAISGSSSGGTPQ